MNDIYLKLQKAVKMGSGSVFTILFSLFTLLACTPDTFDGADPHGIPTVSGIDFDMSVDQETNQMVAKYAPQPGTYPLWIINGTSYSTLQEVGYKNAEAGTYTVELKLGNRNGFSQGGIRKEFTFNETKIDYTSDFRKITGKEWRLANKEIAHLACGPAGTAGVEWWSAQANEKKGTGLYDDRISFTAENRKGGTYTYSAGADGLTYVNKGTTRWGSGTEDFDAQVGDQTAAWSFEVYDWTDADGNVTKQNYIQLAPNTAFPYICDDVQYADPKFRIEELTSKKLVLIYETPSRSIAWRFIFTSEAEQRDVTTDGFDATSDYNLWKGITPTMTFYYNPDPGWGNEQTSLFESLFVGGNNDYSITIPNECYADWQAQVHFHTDINTTVASNYDFSCILLSDKDINDVTVKLTCEADGEEFFFADKVNLKAGEETVFWKSDMPGHDLTQIKLVFDFGHSTGETHVSMSNIVLKDHANNDGTIIPEPGEEETVIWVDVNSADNLGAGFNSVGSMEFWWADAGWSQIGNPQFSYSNGVYTITSNDATSAEWQAQNSIHHVALPIEEGQAYDVRAKIVASDDLGRFTFKICDENDDNNILVYRGDLSLEAGENYVELTGCVAQKEGANSSFNEAKLFIDLGGCPAGFTIELSDIIVQKHSGGGGGSSVVLNYDDAGNLWKAVDDGTNFVQFGYYFADDGWGAIPFEEATHSGDTYEITLPEGLGKTQWQGQFHIDSNLTASGSKTYDFQLTMEVDNDCPQVTFKFTDAGDNNYFFEERQDVPADEPFVFTRTGVSLKEGTDASTLRLFFDFGGSPSGTHIKISKITLIER